VPLTVESEDTAYDHPDLEATLDHADAVLLKHDLSKAFSLVAEPTRTHLIRWLGKDVTLQELTKETGTPLKTLHDRLTKAHRTVKAFLLANGYADNAQVKRLVRMDDPTLDLEVRREITHESGGHRLRALSGPHGQARTAVR
jgi:hypothetical protein